MTIYSIPGGITDQEVLRSVINYNLKDDLETFRLLASEQVREKCTNSNDHYHRKIHQIQLDSGTQTRLGIHFYRFIPAVS